MSKNNQPDKALELATLFHDTYESLAPKHGYETRDDTKQFNPNTPNGKLMIATASQILTHYIKKEDVLDAIGRAETEWSGTVGDITTKVDIRNQLRAEIKKELGL